MERSRERTDLPGAADQHDRAVPAWGNTDIMARALQNEISKALGQTVVIINKGGAAGTLGLIDLSRAAPDGYTVALTPNNPLTAQPHLQKLPYDMDSFRYICLTYYAPYVLIAGPQAPFKTFDEFVKFAKAKSENLVYGHPGLASQPHLGMLAVLKAIGADLDRVLEVGIRDAAMPVSVEDAYRLLKVTEETPLENIKAVVNAYRWVWHPDLARDEIEHERCTLRMQQINIAWDLIQKARAERST